MENLGELFTDDGVLEAIAKGKVSIDIGWENVTGTTEVKPYVRVTPVKHIQADRPSSFWPFMAIVFAAAAGYSLPAFLSMVNL
jgi:hypothetical protein